MKKMTLLLAILIFISGCGINNTPPRNRYVFYYLTDVQNGELKASRIDSEVRRIEVNSPLAVFEEYLKGPESSDLESPFPPSVQVLSYAVSDNTAKIRLSPEFFELTGADRTLAEACITITASELSNVAKVEIIDNAGQVSMKSTDMYLLEEDNDPISDNTITLYFADRSGQYLVDESRQLVSGAGVSDERYIIDQLIKGPIGEELSPVIPENTELLSVSTDMNGVCTVDFSGQFMENKPDTERQELITVYSIVNSLTNLESVESVRITIEGGDVDVYRYMELSRPVTPYDGIIGPVRSGVNEIGIDLYMQSWSPDYLAGLPEIIKRRVNITTEEQLLELLINFQPPDGFVNPVPAGTEINSVSVTDGVCVVDLSSEFLSVNQKDAAAQRLSVLSIAATLSQLEYVDSVQFYIEGESLSLSEYDLSEPITVTEDVFFP